MNNDAFEFKDKGLKGLIRALSESSPTAKVGILGGGKARTEAFTTNAEIGAKHEFGDDTVPQRSFLRMPITEKMQKYLDESKFFDEDAFKLIINAKKLTEWVKKFAILGESIVADAFDSGGFGKWKPSNMDHKKNEQTLVETQQLRNSITSEVKE